jgi:hypothetical protein
MAWRLRFTIVANSDPDFVYNLFSIGLISFLELWLGIIVACIPTLAPLLKTYVKPMVSKISVRSERSRVRLQEIPSTVVSSQGSRGTRKASKIYSEIGEESPVGSFEQSQPTEMGRVTTNCRFEPGTMLPRDAQGGIYVQHDIEAQRA